jgi:hypothetical protein
MMPFKSIYNRNFGFIEQKLYFWTQQRVSIKKNSNNWHHFCHEKKYLFTFLELPLFMLMLILRKDALFLGPLRPIPKNDFSFSHSNKKVCFWMNLSTSQLLISSCSHVLSEYFDVLGRKHYKTIFSSSQTTKINQQECLYLTSLFIQV